MNIYNKVYHVPNGTLIGNWYEEQCLRNKTNEGRSIMEKHIPKRAMNFDYEIKRFDKAFENTGTTKKLNNAMVQGIVNLGIYLGFTITCIYARNLIESDYDHVTVHHLFTAGDVVKVLVSVRKAIISMVEIPPHILIIQEACASASDYFILSERVPEIYESIDNLKPKKS